MARMLLAQSGSDNEISAHKSTSKITSCKSKDYQDCNDHNANKKCYMCCNLVESVGSRKH